MVQHKAILTTVNQ